MKQFILDLLSKSSDTSSKRFIGLWCIFIGTIFGITAMSQIFFDIKIDPNELWIIGLFLGSGLGAFGITAFSKT